MEPSEIEIYYDVEYLENVSSVYWRDYSQGLPSIELSSDEAYRCLKEKNPYKVRVIKRKYETVLTIV